MRLTELPKHFRSKVHIGGDDTVFGYIPYGRKSQKLRHNGREFEEILMPECFLWDNLAALVEHNTANWLGSTLEENVILRSEQDGLYFRVKLQDTPLARDVMGKVQAGKLQVSPASEVIDEVEENGLRKIHRAHLLEISLVDSPAYTQTSACLAVPERKENVRKRMAVLKWDSDVPFRVSY